MLTHDFLKKKIWVHTRVYLGIPGPQVIFPTSKKLCIKEWIALLENAKWRPLSFWNMKITLDFFSTQYFRILFSWLLKKSVARVYPGHRLVFEWVHTWVYPGIPGPQNYLKKSAHKITKICAKKELNDIYMFRKCKKHHYEFLNRIWS